MEERKRMKRPEAWRAGGEVKEEMRGDEMKMTVMRGGDKTRR